MLPWADADTNTHVYTLVYGNHTDRHTLTGSQRKAGTHTHFPDVRHFQQTFVSQTQKESSPMLTHSAVHRENGSINKYRAISPLIEIFLLRKN